MDAESVVPIKNKIMIDKWLLVLLIVGGTSLVFIICFPIDFYLYRRRKKLARERNSNHDNNKPYQMGRAGQYHAQVYPDNTSSTVDVEDKSRAGKGVKKQNKFVRIVNLFRKRKTEQRLMQLQMLTNESKSETSSSDHHPTVLINTEARKDTSKALDSDIPGTVETANAYKPDLLIQSENQVDGHAGDVNVKPSPETNIPYMARAISVMMTENEELFGPESKHLNYGSTEKINGFQINRNIYKTLGQPFHKRGDIVTTSGGEHSSNVGSPTPTGTVLMPESGESCTDNAGKTSDGTVTEDKHIITVRSKDYKTKSQTAKRSKHSNIMEAQDDTNVHYRHDIKPTPLPQGIMTFNFDDSDDTDLDTNAASCSFKHSDQGPDMGTDDGNASPLFRPITTSFSDQYISNQRKAFGPKLSALPSGDIVDEFDNGARGAVDMNASNFSFLEEAAIASRRKKKKKKDQNSANSLPNLSTGKTRILNKQDYYKDRRGANSASTKDAKFSRY